MSEEITIPAMKILEYQDVCPSGHTSVTILVLKDKIKRFFNRNQDICLVTLVNDTHYNFEAYAIECWDAFASHRSNLTFYFSSNEQLAEFKLIC